MNKEKLYNLMGSDLVSGVFFNKDSVTKEQLLKFVGDLHDIVYPIYCDDCGACGHDGCCPVSQCLHFEAYANDYDWMVNDWEKQHLALKQATELAGLHIEFDADDAARVVVCASGNKSTDANELAEWLVYQMELKNEQY